MGEDEDVARVLVLSSMGQTSSLGGKHPEPAGLKQRLKSIALFAVVLPAILLGGSCRRSDAARAANGVSYYDWFGGYVHPLKPGRRLTPQEVNLRRERASSPYYVARTDGDGRIVRIEKWSRGKLELAFDYTYSRNGGLQDAMSTGPDGTRKIPLPK